MLAELETWFDEMEAEWQQVGPQNVA